MQASFGAESLPEHEQLVPCPYNKAHLVVKHRMPNHIIKCRKTHGTAGTKECRFNFSHIVPTSDIMDHEATCPDRVLIDSFIEHRTLNRPEPGSCTSDSGFSSKTSQKGDWDDISVESYKIPKKE